MHQKARESTLGEAHPDTIVSMHNLAELLISRAATAAAAGAGGTSGGSSSTVAAVDADADVERATRLQERILAIVQPSSSNPDFSPSDASDTNVPVATATTQAADVAAAVAAAASARRSSMDGSPSTPTSNSTPISLGTAPTLPEQVGEIKVGTRSNKVAPNPAPVTLRHRPVTRKKPQSN